MTNGDAEFELGLCPRPLCNKRIVARYTKIRGMVIDAFILDHGCKDPDGGPVLPKADSGDSP